MRRNYPTYQTAKGIEHFLSKPLHLGYELPGVRLTYCNIHAGLDPSEPFQRIGAAKKEPYRIVATLNDLKGLVKIPNEAAALRYVRLKTSLLTWYAWPDQPSEVEIISAENAKRLPNFGLGHIVVSQSATGMEGIVSNQAFKRGGFKPPGVVRAGDKFVITRWLLSVTYLEHQKQQRWVQQVREEVSANGGYTKTVQRQMKPPALPNTNLMLPWFE